MKYINQNGEHFKTGPARYGSLPMDKIINCCVIGAKRLYKEERLCLEIELLKNTLSPAILDIVKGKPFKGIEIQHYRNNTSVNTVILGNYRVVCSSVLLKYSDKISEVNRNK